MKQCSKCAILKTETEFYAHPQSKGGRMSVCKDCHKAAVRKRQAENPYVQEYDRARASLPHRRALSRVVTMKWRADHPQAYRAQTAVSNALRDKKIEKGSCAVCGASKVHAHHHDYSNPLEVTWLCPLHHHRLHAKEGSAH